MSRQSRFRVLGALILAATCVAVQGFAPGWAEGPTVIAREGQLVERNPGLPAPGTPAGSQLESAQLRIDHQADRVTGTVVFRADPVPDSTLLIGSGRRDDTGDCVIVDYEVLTVPGPSVNVTGRTVAIDHGHDLFDDVCAGVATLAESGTELDVLGGDMTPVYAVPEPTIAAPSKVAMTPGFWVNVEVTVGNTGVDDLTGVVITGKGRGVRVRRTRVDQDSVPVFDGAEVVREVPVKITGPQRKHRLRLTVTTAGVSRSTTVIVVRRPLPALPEPGRYRSKDGSVTFKITRSGTPKLTRFRAELDYTCRKPLDYPEHWHGAFTHPTVRVRRDGIIDDTDEHQDPNYRTDLEMSVAGSRATGWFRYFTDTGGNRTCEGTVDFTARRTR